MQNKTIAAPLTPLPLFSDYTQTLWERLPQKIQQNTIISNWIKQFSSSVSQNLILSFLVTLDSSESRHLLANDSFIQSCVSRIKNTTNYQDEFALIIKSFKNND